VYTLLLPWLDVAKSYRSVFEDLNAHLALEWNDGDCMASLHGLGESEAPMLYYFSGIRHTPIDDATTTRCTWMIVQGVRAVDPAPGSEWKLFWTGRARATTKNCCASTCARPTSTRCSERRRGAAA
jgi:hypothetical protein